DGVAVADRAVVQAHEGRVAVAQHLDVDVTPGRQAPDHQAGDEAERRGVVDRPGAHRVVGGGLAGGALGDGGIGVVGDQPFRPGEPDHDLVAGVDAEAAVDALDLRAVANVDAHRADHDALVAVDAVAAAGPALGLLVRPAR